MTSNSTMYLRMIVLEQRMVITWMCFLVVCGFVEVTLLYATLFAGVLIASLFMIHVNPTYVAPQGLSNHSGRTWILFLLCLPVSLFSGFIAGWMQRVGFGTGFLVVVPTVLFFLTVFHVPIHWIYSVLVGVGLACSCYCRARGFGVAFAVTQLVASSLFALGLGFFNEKWFL
jgi:hypothetical protein